jgi:hypothetical protein
MEEERQVARPGRLRRLIIRGPALRPREQNQPQALLKAQRIPVELEEEGQVARPEPLPRLMMPQRPALCPRDQNQPHALMNA